MESKAVNPNLTPPERLTGNQLWKLRTKHGRTMLFTNATIFKQEALLYFDWCDRHPLYKYELVKSKLEFAEAEVPLGRPYTLSGFMSYLQVTERFMDTAQKALREKMEKKTATDDELDMLDAMDWVKQAVRTQQVEGATVGLFSSNLVARLQGLADNVNNVNSNDVILAVNVRDQKTAQDMDTLESLL